MMHSLAGTLRRALSLVFICVTFSLHAHAQSFEVAVVRLAPRGADAFTGSWTPPGLNRFAANHLTMERLLMLAYGVDASQIASKPDWLGTNLYDINAKAEDGVRLTKDELEACLQDLLCQRFHLKAHTEIRRIRGYALIVGKDGTTLTPTKGDHRPGFRINVSAGHMEGLNWTMPYLARMLTAPAGFSVVDQTGISGSYDVHFTYAADSTTDSTLPPLTVAIRNALGLEMKPGIVPVETVVIDHIDETPTDN